jgi:hypothetical protein
MSTQEPGEEADSRDVEPKSTPDPQTVEGAVEDVKSSSSDERDELLTDLLCHVYGTLASQNG